jgi:hypothetical protein
MIADGVRSLLLGKVSACHAQGVEINVQQFELKTSCFWGLSQKLITADVVQSFLSERLGLGPRHAFTYGEPYRCCFVVILESRKKDKVAEGIYRQLKESAISQFSQREPAVIGVKLSDITRAELQELGSSGSYSRNALQEIAHRLFDSTDRSFLHTLVFTPVGQAQRERTIENGRITQFVTDTGPCYVFRNPNNSMCSNPQYHFYSDPKSRT